MTIRGRSHAAIFVALAAASIAKAATAPETPVDFSKLISLLGQEFGPSPETDAIRCYSAMSPDGTATEARSAAYAKIRESDFDSFIIIETGEAISEFYRFQIVGINGSEILWGEANRRNSLELFRKRLEMEDDHIVSGLTQRLEGKNFVRPPPISSLGATNRVCEFITISNESGTYSYIDMQRAAYWIYRFPEFPDDTELLPGEVLMFSIYEFLARQETD